MSDEQTPADLTPPDNFGDDLVARYADQFDEGDADVAALIGAALADESVPSGADVPAGAGSAADETAGTASAESSAVPPADSAGAEPLPPPDAEAVQEPVEVGGYVWRYSEGDQPVEQLFTDEQVRQALYLAADQRTQQGLLLADWADKLSPEAREQLGAVSTGQAVAVPRADFDRYQAWLHSQQTQSRLPADLDQYDPDAAKLIRDQAEQIARLEATQPAQQQPVGPGGGYQDQVNAQELARQYNDAIGGIRESWQLSNQEVDALYVAARPFVASLQMQNSVYHPITHELVAPADPADVMHRAFSFALTQNPALHNAIIARNQSHPNQQFNEPTAQTLAPVADIAAKRARAASLASAPSAAVTPSPRSVVQMSDQEVVDAMTEELARAMNGHTG